MSTQPCENCPSNRSEHLTRLGISVAETDFVLALAGNPNVGKTTVFNALTGLRQHTGNWPGKTVVRAEGAFQYGEKRYKIVDLPGTYSLLSTSADEEVARDFILFGQPDVTVIVADSTRLERNLNLVLQILEITDHAVLCLNLIDEAHRAKFTLDERSLARDLGIPVVPTSARVGVGIPELLRAIHDVATGATVCKPYRNKSFPKNIRTAVADLAEQVQSEFPSLPNARWVALRLLEGDARIVEALRTGELGSVSQEKTPLTVSSTQ